MSTGKCRVPVAKDCNKKNCPGVHPLHAPPDWEAGQEMRACDISADAAGQPAGNAAAGYRKWPCLEVRAGGGGIPKDHEIAVAHGVHPASAKALHPAAKSALRAAFMTSNLWPVGHQLKIAFLDGTAHQKQWVRQTITKYLAPLVNLEFQWNQPARGADVRISFATKGAAWSMLGIDSKNAGKDASTGQIDWTKPSMNLGWIDDDTDCDAVIYRSTGQVVLHEWGHCLGMIHEHESKLDNPICWNKPCVYEALGGSPNFWDESTVQHNMFDRYEHTQINGSKYDPKSIMEYWFARSWVLCGPKLSPNTKYSDLDRIWLGCAYPHTSDRAKDWWVTCNQHAATPPDGSAPDGPAPDGAGNGTAPSPDGTGNGTGPAPDGSAPDGTGNGTAPAPDGSAPDGTGNGTSTNSRMQQTQLRLILAVGAAVGVFMLIVVVALLLGRKRR